MELLKPRVMENGTEYYLSGDVRICIEQAAKQIEESHSAYKELDRIIKKQKRKRCLANAQKEWYRRLNVCNYPNSKIFIKACRHEQKWLEIADKFKEA